MVSSLITESSVSVLPSRSRLASQLIARLSVYPDNTPERQRLNAFIEKTPYESRLLKDVAYTYQGPDLPGGNSFSHKGVQMFHRSSFMDAVQNDYEKRGGELNNTERVFLLLDIENLRDANKAGAADYMLAEVAGTIRNEEETMRGSLSSQTDIESGRYAGDEFMISLIGNPSEEQTLMLKRTLEERITKLNGFYGVSEDKVRPGNIGLKNGKVEVIKAPRGDVFDETIFEYYFSRGTILSSKQIDQEKKRFKTLDDFKNYMNSDRQNAVFAYPEDVKDNTLKKVDYLIKRYPELGHHLEDALRVSGNDEEFIAQLLTFIETNMFDHLLGQNIIPFSDMAVHLEEGSFGDLWMFDCKFIKEANDYKSLSEADELIRNLWQKIDSSIDPEDKPKLLIGRRGGTFALAVRMGMTLSSKTMIALSQLHEVSDPTNRFYVPIGQARVSIPEVKNELRKKPSSSWNKNVLSEAENQAEKDFYTHLLKIARESDLSLIFPSPDTDQLFRDYTNREQLIYLFFNGSKRNYERLSKALALLQSGDTSLSGSEYFAMRNVVESLYEYERRKKYRSLGVRLDT